MRSFSNSKKDNFLASRQRPSIEDEAHNIADRCKFNFSYFQEQDAGQSFSDWTHDQLTKLLEKLKYYGCESLQHWKNERVGAGGGRVLVVYERFPPKSEFTEPMHVPHQAQWGRFRLESGVRLVGFVLPSECRGKMHSKTGVAYDCNTFYVVFLDANHKFWITEKR